MNNRKRIVLFCLLNILILVLSLNLISAEPYYHPYAHHANVPEHPELKPVGSLRTETFTGAETYEYELEVPKGTNNLTPSVVLSYNSLSTYSKPTFLGTGWVLSSYDYIQRNTNYSFASTGDDYFDLYFQGNKYTLVYVPSEGRWHTDVESFIFVDNYTDASAPNTNKMYWLVKTTEGNTYRFGYNPEAEMIAFYNYTWRWSLDLVNDTHNNSVFYNYSENPIAGESTAVYPLNIKYNNDKNRTINFVLETSNRTDKWQGYEEGSYIIQSRRIKEIIVSVNNELVKRYVIEYKQLGSSMRTSIANMTIYGNDNITTLPSMNFNYYTPTEGWNSTASVVTTWTPPSGAAFVDSGGGEDHGVRIADYDGDGRADILKRLDCSTSSCMGAWLNNGAGWSSDATFEPPIDAAFMDDEAGEDQGVRILDLNRDGRQDLIKRKDCSTAGCTEAWISTNSGWVSNSTYELPQDAAFVTSSGDDLGARLADLNGDGLLDIVKGCASGGCNNAWINNGSGWTENSTWAAPVFADFVDSNYNDTGIRVIDLNGDGLDDLLLRTKCSSSSCEDGWLNIGNGWENLPNNSPWFPGSSDMSFMDPGSSGNNTDQGVRIIDVNGDGLDDLLLRQDCGSSSCKGLYLNNGNGWTSDSTSSWIPAISDEVPFVDNSGGTDQGVRIADVNGDGVADLIKRQDCSSSPCRNAYLNKVEQGYLLQNYTNELGGMSELTYKESTSINNTGSDSVSDLFFNTWVVETRADKSGMRNTTSNYTYSGGFFDYSKQEFNGFFRVVEVTGNQTVVEHYYYQDSVLSGRENTTTTRNLTNTVYQNISRVWVYTTQDGYSTPYLQTEIIATYDKDNPSGTPKRANTTYAYDSFGNVIEKNFSGDYENTGDQVFEKFEYRNNSDKWITGALINHTIFGFSSSNKIKQTFYSYDEQAYGVAPTKGSITRKEEWLSGGTNPITIYGYNATTGNLINMTSPNGNVTRYFYGITDTTNTFINKIVDATGHTTYLLYNLSNSQIQVFNDSNQVLTNYSYDEFGRIEKEMQPYDSSTYPTKEYVYTLDGQVPEQILIKQREKSGTDQTFDTYYFYDGFGNLIQVKQETDNNDQIVADIYYDGLNRVVKVSNPYFNDSTSIYTPPVNINGTNYTYDSLNNVINVTNPDGTNKQIQFNRWNVTVIDEKGNKTKYILDANEQIVTVIEYFNEVGNVLYYTNYSYNPLQQVIQINDTLGNTFNYTYDTLGRLTKMQDPDLGAWNYSYDNVNNLKLQEDARGIKTEFSYDKINRVTRKNTSDIFVNYTYDIPLNGTLVQVKTNLTITNNSYDNRLRILNQEQWINGRSLSTNKTYDALNRLVNETLPDGTVIVYNHSEGNLLRIIGNLTTSLVNISYNEFNTPKTRKYNNSLVTNLTYNTTNNRLTEINTSNVQVFKYEYNPIGNVMKITDNITAIRYTMLYDSLNRLVFVNITNNTILNNTYNYTYNAIGNVLQIAELNQNTTLSYQGKPLHAPSFMNTTKNITVTPSPPPPLTQGTPILNSTYGTNLTTENLTVYNQSTSGSDVKNIINWFRNTSSTPMSLMVVNMPIEGGFNPKDYSGFNNNGFTLGTTYNPIGGYDGKGAFEFDGVNDRVDIQDTTAINTGGPYENRSISIRFKANNITNTQVIWEEGSNLKGLNIYVADEKVFVGGWDLPGNESNWQGTFLNTSINVNTWYHVAMVLSNGTTGAGSDKFKGYLNGVEFGSGDGRLLYDHEGNMALGAKREHTRYHNGSSLGFGDYFNGTIDEFMIFNVSLSSDQVSLINRSRTDVIHSSMTEVGDIWYAEITPNDGFEDGLKNLSNTLTIVLPQEPPTQNTPILNSTFGTNLTTENLTLYNISTFDINGDPVENIINWYRNESSLMLLNVNFGGGTNGTNASDYSGRGITLNGSGYPVYESGSGPDEFGVANFTYSSSSTPKRYYNVSNFNSSTIDNISFSIEMMILKYPAASTSRILQINRTGNNAGAGMRITAGAVSGVPAIVIQNTTDSLTINGVINITHQWHHIIFIVDRQNNRLYAYIDNILQTNTTGNIPTNIIGGDLIIGGTLYLGGTTQDFNGSIAYIRIWNASLSSEQVNALFNNQSIIDHHQTEIGDTWNASITPDDQRQVGMTQFSNNVTIVG